LSSAEVTIYIFRKVRYSWQDNASPAPIPIAAHRP
jgi:hypothetical protein